MKINRYLLPLLLLLMLLSLCACGEKAPAKQALPAPDALTAEVLSSGAFTEELGAAEKDVSLLLYGIEEADAPGLRCCFSGGSVADELAVFPCADDAAAQRVTEACKSRLELQKRLFADYSPKEVPKLDGAMLLRRDNTVLLCVASDAAKAKAVLDKYF